MKITTALLGAALLPAALAAQETARPFEPERLTLSAGEGRPVIADRGLLPVKLVRADASSKTIHVEFYRFHRDAGADPSTPPVFLLNGGPGFPGLGDNVRDTTFMARMVTRFTAFTDLVVVGQRGIGSSTPNTACDPPAPIPADVEPTQERRVQHVRAALEKCRAHWEGEGYDLRGFNVIEAAGDVNDVRAALGYDRITIFGGSFGSHWGMALMRYHPEIVARAVLNGLEGPDHTYDDPAGVLKALRRIAEAAEADPRLAPHIPDGGIVAVFGRVAAELDGTPVEHAVPGSTLVARIDGDVLRGFALGFTRQTSSRAGIRSWPSDMLRLIARDWSGIAPRVAMGARTLGGLPTASFFMLDCGSGITPARHARLAADPAQKIVGDPGRFYDLACPVWGADLGDAFRQNFTTAIPTLLVHGTWDTSTPYDNALELAPFFTNGKLVTIEGGSHGALNEAIDAFPSFAAAVFRFAATGATDGIPERLTLPAIDWVVPELPSGR